MRLTYCCSIVVRTVLNGRPFSWYFPTFTYT